jgi:hypothetical protein
VALTIDRNLPHLFATADTTLDNLADLSDSFKQYKGLMGVVHNLTPSKDLLSYGSSILSWVEGTANATIGVKKPGEAELKHVRPAREWVAAARKDIPFLGAGNASKSDLLYGLARTNSLAPLHIKIGDQAPRLLADWLKETHPDSKGVR